MAGIVAGATVVAACKPPAAVAVIASSAPLRLVQLARGQCKFPLDDPGPGRMDETRFCAQPCRAGAVYCEGHAWLSLSIAARAKAVAR